MQRTIKQLVFDLLDQEGNLTPAEIAKRLDIKHGSACGHKNRWKRARGYRVGSKQYPLTGGLLRIPAGEDGHVPSTRGPQQPSFRKPSVNVNVIPKASAPAEVTFESLIQLATKEQLGEIVLVGLRGLLEQERDEEEYEFLDRALHLPFFEFSLQVKERKEMLRLRLEKNTRAKESEYEQSLVGSRIPLEDTLMPKHICANLRRSGLFFLDQLKGDEDKWVRNIGKRAMVMIRAEIKRLGGKV